MNSLKEKLETESLDLLFDKFWGVLIDNIGENELVYHLSNLLWIKLESRTLALKTRIRIHD